MIIGSFCALEYGQRLESISNDATNSAGVEYETANVTEQTTGSGDAIGRETPEINLPIYREVGSHGTDDSVIPPGPTVDRNYSWPVKFANGKTDISFLIGSHWSLLNEAKGWVEGFVKEPVNWWPLAPRRYPLPEGCVWVNWKCVSIISFSTLLVFFLTIVRGIALW